METIRLDLYKKQNSYYFLNELPNSVINVIYTYLRDHCETFNEKLTGFAVKKIVKDLNYKRWEIRVEYTWLGQDGNEYTDEKTFAKGY